MVRSPRPRHTKRRSLAVRRNARLLAKPGALELFHRYSEVNINLPALIAVVVAEESEKLEGFGLTPNLAYAVTLLRLVREGLSFFPDALGCTTEGADNQVRSALWHTQDDLPRRRPQPSDLAALVAFVTAKQLGRLHYRVSERQAITDELAIMQAAGRKP